MKKLGAFSKPVAWLIVIAVIVVAVLGIGGIKLNAKYNNALKTFKSATNTPNSNGSTFESDFTEALSYAAPIEACAARVLGKHDAAVRLTECYNAANASRGNAAKGYPAIMELYAAVTNAYDVIKLNDADAANEIAPAVSNFRSDYHRITFSYAAAYAQYKDAIDALAGGFPASLLRKIWGIGNEAE